MKYLLAVGACYLDTILDVERYPAEDEKLRASRIIKRRGGNCPNTIEVLQQLLDTVPNNSEVSIALCATLPSRSSTGYQEIQSSFTEPSALQYCICRDDASEPASSYIIRSSAADSRTIINYNGLQEMTVEEFASVADKLGKIGLAWCHFEVIHHIFWRGYRATITKSQGRIPDVTLACIQHLRRHHREVKISVEVEKPGREGLQDLAAVADIVFYSKSWALGNGHESPRACLEAQASLTSKASLLLCTWGASGVSAMELSSHRYIECPAFKEEKSQVVDTVGAGDTFIAGMLHVLICDHDWSLEKQLQFATELAGRKVVQEGLQGLGSLMEHAL
ncbi:MAG: hypothetical protein Q9220_000835 [cf. Caloplaca sp. 1 TL-2023]